MYAVAWILALAAALVGGACLAGAFIATQRAQTAFLVGLLTAIAASAASVAAIAGTAGALLPAGAAALLGAGFFSGGYALAAAASPSLLTKERHLALPTEPPLPHRFGIVFIACIEGTGYSAAAVSRALVRLRDTGVPVPPEGAWPLVHQAEKTRYRFTGPLTGSEDAEKCVERIIDTVRERIAHAMPTSSPTRSDGGDPHRSEAHPEPGGPDIEARLVLCDTSPSISEALTLALIDRRQPVVVTLGPWEEWPAEAALRDAEDQMCDAGLAPFLRIPSVHDDDRVVQAIVERVIALTRGDTANVGVILAAPGRPEEWATFVTSARDKEVYLLQRVRAALVESGLEGDRIRVAYSAWEEPDVTEAARHLAARGCTLIVVAPAGQLFGGFWTALDLPDALAEARLPGNVRALIADPWGLDERVAASFADRIVRALRDQA